jgi:hypothetical protein
MSEQGEKEMTRSSRGAGSATSTGELRDALVAFSDEVFEAMQRLLQAQHDLTHAVLGGTGRDAGDRPAAQDDGEEADSSYAEDSDGEAEDEAGDLGDGGAYDEDIEEEPVSDEAEQDEDTDDVEDEDEQGEAADDLEDEDEDEDEQGEAADDLEDRRGPRAARPCVVDPPTFACCRAGHEDLVTPQTLRRDRTGGSRPAPRPRPPTKRVSRGEATVGQVGEVSMGWSGRCRHAERRGEQQPPTRFTDPRVGDQPVRVVEPDAAVELT